ncbi:hypothetical protein ACYF6T_29580 [Streptomyces sp. 7R007]
MAFMAHTHAGIAARPRSARERVAGARPSRKVASPEEQDRPTDTQMWNWAESAALSGYGPSAFSFLR